MGRRRKDALPPLSDSDDSKPRNCANERERDRMRVLSKAFTKLKTTLPWVPPDTKLSKLDTLRLATCYIAHLRQILAEDDHVELTTTSDVTSGGRADVTDECAQNSELHSRCQITSAVRQFDAEGRTDGPLNNGGSEAAYGHPLSLTWPFNFNGRHSVGIPGQDPVTPGRHPVHRTSHHPGTSPRVDRHEPRLL